MLLEVISMNIYYNMDVSVSQGSFKYIPEYTKIQGKNKKYFVYVWRRLLGVLQFHFNFTVTITDSSC